MMKEEQLRETLITFSGVSEWQTVQELGSGRTGAVLLCAQPKTGAAERSSSRTEGVEHGMSCEVREPSHIL